MNKRLKSAIQWSVFIILIIITVITLFSLVMVMVAPTWFKGLDISGFNNYIIISGIILSFLSVGMGALSIWQAKASNKESAKILDKIQIIQHQQEILNNKFDLLKFGNSFVSATSKPQNWEMDDVVD